MQFKADVVSLDLRESTSVGGRIGRELLNYGHPGARDRGLGAFPDASRRSRRARHDLRRPAVAPGARPSGRAVAVHRQLIGALGLPTSYQRAPFAELRELMGRDKKTRGQALRFVGLRNLSDPAMIVAPSEAILEECYAELGRDQ